MWEWIQGHVAVILICMALIALVALIIRSLIRDRQKGKHACGAGCAHCAMAGSCHGGEHPGGSAAGEDGVSGGKQSEQLPGAGEHRP